MLELTELLKWSDTEYIAKLKDGGNNKYTATVTLNDKDVELSFDLDTVGLAAASYLTDHNTINEAIQLVKQRLNI